MQPTDIIIDFTTGLSGSVAWPWPIAVYLFLAGISGGAVALAVILNLFSHSHADTPQMKAASIVGLVTILLGMVCLVLDLTDPFQFWRILIYYNPTSVMSIGVMALLFYIPLLFVLTLLVFKDLKILAFLKPITDFLAGFRVLLDWAVMILAIVICAYTGFLISALIRFPLINTAVLPALFVASGFSAGGAAVRLVAMAFGAQCEDAPMHQLHVAEYPIILVEAMCIFMIAVSLITGTEAAQLAFTAFTTGTWSCVFWFGAIFIGMVVPITLSFFRSAFCFYTGCTAAIVGMMCLRLFILYAGQLNGLN